MLVGSVSPAIGALLSAHQSIGVPQPLKMFGTAEQKQTLPAPARRRRGLGVPAHRARRRLRPGPPRHHRRADRDGGYLLNGVKLWATNGTVATLLVVMARVPPARGAAAASPRSWWRPTAGHHRRAAQRVPGPARPGEQRHPVPRRVRPGRERDRRRGQGPQDRPDHAEHGPALAAGDVRGRRQVGAERRPGVGRRPGPVGPAGRPARGGRQEDRVHRRHHVRHGVHARPVLPARRRRPQRHPDRGGAGQAVRQRDGLADRRRADPDPGRARLRDGRLARGPGRAADRRRADPARPADQPDLRGLDRDHAPADRPRGGRRAPLGGRRHHRPRRRRSAARPGPGARAGGFYARWLPTLAVGKGQAPGGVRASSARWPRTCATSSAPRASWPASTFYAMSRWQGKMERKQALPRPHRGHRRRAVRDVGGLRAGPTPSATHARRAWSWPTCSAGRPGCGPTRCSPRCGTTPTRSTSGAQGGSSPAATPSWRRASSPPPTDAARVAGWERGPSAADDVRRRIPPPA